ncbi:CheR family methyltransferase [Woodsholea maritima]|uniref:CheR family methyltransferase n=1 Tax=Woodsholea maritima TaxID=240237 RepID=UPI00035D3F59|nr:protein-glutamate O-methyltransferase [Woodsholea maritima]
MALSVSKSDKNQNFENREFAMSEADFQKIKTFIYDRAGISLSDQKRGLVYARLTRRLRDLGLTTFKAYLDYLAEGQDNQEFSNLVNALTTNHTKFFRERHHFDFLRGTAAAQWRKQLTRGAPSKIRIWSAGCSTGEEPYTIAMTMAHAFDLDFDWKILATDIDTTVLSHAKRGQYSVDTARDIPAQVKHRYMRSLGQDLIEVDKQLQSHIRFNRLNLHGNWPMKGPFDAIFCRNVTIYFDPPTKNKLIQRFIQLLPPGGFLFLGHSETLASRDLDLEPLGRTVYQRPMKGG